MKMMTNRWIARLLLAIALPSGSALAGEVEVLHFWTSPGEAKSVAELKLLLAARGHTWKDFAVVGGGGQNAMIALKQRVLAGNPPASASLKGPAVKEWASTNAFTHLDTMAQYEHWDDVLPDVVQEQVKYKGHYVAVPVNIHRVNWLWSNTEVLRRSGVVAPPATIEEFFAAADKIKAAGFVPVAHGGQPWQDFALFESIALGVGGPEFYRRALIRLDPSALGGVDMKRSLDTFRRVKAYVDDKSRGRDWNAATAMVIRGSAAFQFMGDWAKGEFRAADLEPGRDYACTAAPGSSAAFSYVVDTFAMFQLANWEAQKAQGYLAFILLGKQFQRQFNLRKGSIPARMDVPLDDFDTCAQSSRQAFDVTRRSGGLLPSVAIDMALPPQQQAALRSAVSDFWNNDTVSADETISRLLQAASAPRTDSTRQAAAAPRADSARSASAPRR